MPKIIQKKTKILSNFRVSGNYYKLVFSLPEIARVARPGQFMMLRISRNYTPLLRRPFSIHSIHNHKHKICIEILYEIVGKGTKILSEKPTGGYLDILGPLGNGFNLSAARHPPSAILVAGGMGVAPLFFLAQRLTQGATHEARRNIFVLIGAKTKKEILCKKEFASLGLDVKISSNDGSAGFQGQVTDLLSSILRTKAQTHKGTNEQVIYACGPRLMLSEIAVIAKKYHTPAQVSLDEYMACGLGVCLGCTVQTKDGQQLVCKDGPVFEATKIKW
jgi:dihydroorotate dehydrogenase electron transfer subunit